MNNSILRASAAAASLAVRRRRPPSPRTSPAPAPPSRPRSTPSGPTTTTRPPASSINYQSVGSGAGIRQIEAKTVDFGASDTPLKDDELAKKGLIQFPTVIGGVVPVVNIKGIAPGQLQADRPGARRHLPGQDHQVERPGDHGAEPGADAARRRDHRRCAAPTARAPRFIFTNYLSKVNAEWKAKVGEGTAVNWPTGAGGKGNEGVAAFVRPPAQLDRLRRVRLRQAEQDDATRCCRTRRASSSRRTTTPSRRPPPAPTGPRASTRS